MSAKPRVGVKESMALNTQKSKDNLNGIPPVWVRMATKRALKSAGLGKRKKNAPDTG
jgi:hypothetical protein